jgi:hypothetical protein
MSNRHKENNSLSPIKRKYDQWSDKMMSGIFPGIKEQKTSSVTLVFWHICG